MAADAYIGTRVEAQMKEAFRAVAEQQDLSESALLKQLLGVMVGRGRERVPSTPQRCEARKPGVRLCARLRADDLMLLRERAAARDMKPGTYLSTLVRAHLRSLTPLPKKELGGLMQASHQLGAIGRNLNQIARLLHQGGRSAGPSREELLAVVKACGGLRDHVRDLMEANLKTWEAGFE